MAKPRNGLPIFLKELDRWAASVAYTGPLNAAQETVTKLQKKGPVWTGEYANSWQITGASRTSSGTKQPGAPAKIKVPRLSGKSVTRAILGKDRISFNIVNTADHKGYAEDKVPGRFKRFTPVPIADGRKWVQTDTGRKPGETLRYDIGGGSEKSVSSRTAPVDWLLKFERGGELDKTVKIEVDKAIQKVKTRSKGFK
tara:strand:+ start:836 stop:1429 length:594 start_codon:yes stop_codon:yes gene_type:complete